jgi:hypothetical protein
MKERRRVIVHDIDKLGAADDRAIVEAVGIKPEVSRLFVIASLTGVDQDQATIVRGPTPVLDRLGALDNQMRPRLAYRQHSIGFHFDFLTSDRASATVTLYLIIKRRSISTDRGTGCLLYIQRLDVV